MSMYKKKSLGQHFLRSENILKKIADAAELAQSDVVLEVGPGEGFLTALILQRAGRVIAVEKDDRLIPVLKNKFKNEIASGALHLIHADILSLPANHSPLPANYKVVANLPYYITGAFLRTFLQTDNQPESMTLLLQKEVAKRIACLPHPARRRQVAKESLLSLSVKCYGAPRYIADVPRGAFSPPPKVDSAILVIENISKRFFSENGLSEAFFFQTLKRGFAHPRKLLSGNLGLAGSELEKLGLSQNIRAEQVDLKGWERLALLLARAAHNDQ